MTLLYTVPSLIVMSLILLAFAITPTPKWLDRIIPRKFRINPDYSGRPTWEDELGDMSWKRVNGISLLVALFFGIISAVWFAIEPHNVWYAAYYTECLCVIGYIGINCAITDALTYKANRYMLKRTYAIQYAISSVLLYFAYSYSIERFFMWWGIMTASMVFAIALGYIKFFGIGANDARELAVMVAATFPILRFNVFACIALSIVLVIIVGIIMGSLAQIGHHEDISYVYGANDSILTKRNSAKKSLIQKIADEGEKKRVIVDVGTKRHHFSSYGTHVPACMVASLPFAAFMLIALF